jgi:glycosyltransferase involved in cell wall biosynthesis
MLIVYDKENWCLHFAAQGLQRYWNGNVEIACQDDPEIQHKVKGADCVVAMCRGTYQKIKSDPRRTLIAVGSDKVLPQRLGPVVSGELTLMNKDLLKDVAGVLCANSFLHHEWAKYHSRAFYCPIGYDPKLFYQTVSVLASPPPLMLAWVGDKTRQEKRFNEVVLPAMDRLGKKAYMRIAGPKGSAIIFIPHDQLCESLYRNIHALVVASSSEGGPQPAIEAMACGTPVVTTRVGILRDFIRSGTNGWFFDGTVNGLITTLEYLVLHPREIRACGDQAVKRVESLSWTNVVKLWEKAIYEAIADHRR